MYVRAFGALALVLVTAASTSASEPVFIGIPAYEQGMLERSDERSGPRFQDHYAMRGRAGEKIEIKVVADDIVVVATLRGHGLEQASQPNTSGESMVEVTLPRDGEYQIAVSGTEMGQYALTVMDVCSAPHYLDANGQCVSPR